MSPHLLSIVHRVVGWTAVLALVLATSLAHRDRRIAIAATSIATLAATLGATLYPSYLRLVRHAVAITSPSHARLFERKEHLAVAAVALAWVGCASAFAPDRTREGSRRGGVLVVVSYGAATTLAFLVAFFGEAVARVRGF